MSGSAFIKEDFLLETDLARHLFHDVAKDLPIIDYHCHLPVDQIRENHKFRSITEIWLDGDHYKWRAMRANGVSESEIVRRAIAAFLDREKGVAASPQLPGEAAWQEILASFAQVRLQSTLGEPQR